jgi:7-keto-8-aminopelargonate synthetase-like enzyme/REP element-mobilizing transposase RayT
MANLDDQLGGELEQLRADGLYRTLRTIGSAQGPRIVLDGREFLNFSSNDYLGLANDPILKRAAAHAIEEYGVGSGASRLVCGNLQPYEELERRLAAFKGKEAAIVFGSGYAANAGTITALVGEGDVVILDKLDHASIIDGARQSGATLRVYPHGNLRKLEYLLAWAVNRGRNAGPTTCGARAQNSAGAALLPRPARCTRTIIVTETLFSMGGDLAPLKEIVELKERYGVWLMIDEAHSTGLYGHHRRGMAEAAGVEDRIDVTLNTLSKALGCAGGFVAGSQVLINYLRNRARSLIYSTALPPAVCAAASAAVDFVMGDEGHKRRDRLWRNVSELKNGLSALGVENESRSPIIPIIVGDEGRAVEMSRKLCERGVFVPAIRFPTVPKGKARLRVTVTAGHQSEDIRTFLAALKSVGVTQSLAHAPSSVGAVSNRDRVAPTTEAPSRTESTRTTTEQRPRHSNDLRKGRVFISHECYFVTTFVEGPRPILMNPKAAQIVVETLRWLRNEGRIRLLGFVIMPDHVDVALALCNNLRLEQVMHSWKRRSSRLIRTQIVGAVSNRDLEQTRTAETNRSHESRHCLWQPGYHHHLLRDGRDFEQRLAYMHENPVRNGLVKSAQEWPFSTAHPDYQGEIDRAWLGGTPAQEDHG